MKGTVLAVAAVLTLGTSWVGLTGMAAERSAAEVRARVAVQARATPGPAAQIWYGGTLPPITVRAEAYSAVVMNPPPALTPPTRKA